MCLLCALLICYVKHSVLCREVTYMCDCVCTTTVVQKVATSTHTTHAPRDNAMAETQRQRRSATSARRRARPVCHHAAVPAVQPAGRSVRTTHNAQRTTTHNTQQHTTTHNNAHNNNAHNNNAHQYNIRA